MEQTPWPYDCNGLDTRCETQWIYGSYSGGALYSSEESVELASSMAREMSRCCQVSMSSSRREALMTSCVNLGLNEIDEEALGA